MFSVALYPYSDQMDPSPYAISRKIFFINTMVKVGLNKDPTFDLIFKRPSLASCTFTTAQISQAPNRIATVPGLSSRLL